MEHPKANIIRPQAGFQENFVRSNVDFAIGGSAMGVGKEAPLSSHILTPNGWKKMGDIKIGDEICTPYDNTTKVSAIFPQGVKDVYCITTDDGRKAECGIEHLWNIRTKEQIVKYKRHLKHRDFHTLTTSEIMEVMKQEEVYLPLSFPIEFKAKRYSTEPYEMGVIVGSSGSFSLSNHEGYEDEFMYDEYLDSINSHEVGIPEEYFWGSIQQRKDVLRGIIDTNGEYISKERYTYKTSDANIADDIVKLCRTLGYIVKKEKTRKHILLTINTPKSDNECLHTRIVSIKKVRREECQCIYVEDDKHLYIMDDYMVTHNSFAALLIPAEFVDDPNFRMVYLRRNIGDLKTGGSGTDEAEKIYGHFASLKLSDSPRLTFPSGAFIDFTHMSDQTPNKVLERVRGWQYDVVYIDEGTGFEWSTIKMIFSRNRGKGRWTGKVRLTCNPKKRHWLRKWVAWWVDPLTGFPIPERDGIVRYFYIKGETVDDVVFGDTKREVYEKCRAQIDPILDKMNSSGDHYTYEDVVKSTTFYSGKLSDNKKLLENNPGYIGSIAAMGEKQSLANLQGCWNVDTDEEEDIPIPYKVASRMIDNDEMRNGDWWITADLADKGKDNFVALVWDGFHIVDCIILGDTTPKQNAKTLIELAEKYGIPDNHIVYDGIRGIYINDYIEGAQPFFSNNSPKGYYKRNAFNLKDECYLRLVHTLSSEGISFSEAVSSARYKHKEMKSEITIFQEFLEECAVVRFKETTSGKKRLLSKKEMNEMLGKGRSMDMLDPIAMRMFPYLEYPYGEELEMSRIDKELDMKYDDSDENSSIYNDSTWA